MFNHRMHGAKSTLPTWSNRKWLGRAGLGWLAQAGARLGWLGWLGWLAWAGLLGWAGLAGLVRWAGLAGRPGLG